MSSEPNPSPSGSRKPATKYIIAAVVGAALLGCVGVSCISLVVWAVMSRMPAVVAKGDLQGKGDAVAAAMFNGKTADHWGYQDLQDFLAEKGIKTSRGAVAGGMLYQFGGNGTQINMRTSGLDDPQMRNFALRGHGTFFALQMDSSESAKKGAEELKDVAQQDVLALGKFVIRGAPSTLDALRKAVR